MNCTSPESSPSQARTARAVRSRAGLALAAVLALVACEPTRKAPGGVPAQAAHEGDSEKATKAAAAATAQSEPANAGPSHKAPLLSRRREIMSTRFELSIAGAAQPEAAGRLLERALDEIERLEDVLSEWRPDTQISRVNAAAGSGAWVTLGPESLAVVQAGLNVSAWSGGAYDLSWAALRGLYKFDGTTRVPSESAIQSRLAHVGYKGIDFSRDPPRMRLKREGMAIGTGSIAKGYALDRVSVMLAEAHYDNYLLFAGGQVQVHGTREGRAWRVGIQHPRRGGEHVAFVELFEGSVSTSGDYEHAFVEDGVLWHHIIDLSTGYPARRSVSVTLIAPEGVYADALSTACFVLGPEGCLDMLQKLPFEAHAVIIDPELAVHVSPGLAGKVVFTRPLVDGHLPAE